MAEELSLEEIIKLGKKITKWKEEIKLDQEGGYRSYGDWVTSHRWSTFTYQGSIENIKFKVYQKKGWTESEGEYQYFLVSIKKEDIELGEYFHRNYYDRTYGERIIEGKTKVKDFYFYVESLVEKEKKRKERKEKLKGKKEKESALKQARNLLKNNSGKK